MLYPEVIANARFFTDQTGSDQGGTDAELIAILGPLYTQAVRRLSKSVPDYYTFQVEGDLSGTPTNPVRKYTQIRKVERRLSSAGVTPERWGLVPPADPNTTGDPWRTCWRAIGENIEILSPVDTSAEVWRVEYIPNLALPNDVTELDIPDGLDLYLAHQLAIPIRIRLDQSTTKHESEAARIWDEVTTGLLPQTAQVRTVSDYDDDEVC